MPNNINELPYAQWLEQTLKDIMILPVKGVCLNAVLEGGEIYTAYHKIAMQDKITIAGIVQQDAMIDTLAANGLIEYADEEDDSDGEEEE